MPGRGRGRPPHPDLLTPAEQRVLDELRKGGTNVEIAVRLGLSPETVKTHIARMLGKLGLDDRHALAAWQPDRERRRLLAPFTLPAALASLGRPLLWAAAGVVAVAATAVAIALVVALGNGDPVPVAVPATPTPQSPHPTISFPESAGDPALQAAICGAAVPVPTANAELVRDCASLLKARDRLAGDATLNWSADRPMTEWTGVTIAGVPRRVTKLDLSDSGLTGELTGLLGNLRGLAELRLSGNALTGRIPSKLQLLTALTHLYLDNDALTGCLPALLRNVPNNDLVALNLPDCAPPRRVSDEPRVPLLEGGQTVSYQDLGRGPVLVVDLPEGYTFTVEVISGDPIDPEIIPGTVITVVVANPEGYKSWVAFDPSTGEEAYRAISGKGVVIPGLPPTRVIPGIPHLGDVAGSPITGDPLYQVFQRISESAWLLPTLPCDAGLAVPNPDANPELVGDCESLLKVRDRLSGTATLHWSADRPMTQWTGVTVAGTPQRVTKLNLARKGLHGELSGLIGDLTALTELRLDFNRLTGIVPSKLQQLTSLTHLSREGNLFTGCLPASLRKVANNDLATLGLADCAAPIDISQTAPAGDGPLTAGTYSFTWKEGDPPLIFDVPAGLTLRVQAYALAIRSVGSSQGPLGLLLNVEGSESLIGLDVYRSKEWSRYIAEEANGASGEASASPEALESLFDLVVESAWLGNVR